MSPETYDKFVKDLKKIFDKYKYDITHYNIEFSCDSEVVVTIETNIQHKKPLVFFRSRSKAKNEKDPFGRNVMEAEDV